MLTISMSAGCGASTRGGLSIGAEMMDLTDKLRMSLSVWRMRAWADGGDRTGFGRNDEEGDEAVTKEG